MATLIAVFIFLWQALFGFLNNIDTLIPDIVGKVGSFIDQIPA